VARSGWEKASTRDNPTGTARATARQEQGGPARCRAVFMGGGHPAGSGQAGRPGRSPGEDPGHLTKSIGKNARTSISPYHMVDKLPRAHGGCLGTNCRGRTRYTAIRSGEGCAPATAGDVRMGKPARGNACASPGEHIARRREPGELKHLSTRRNRDDSPSSGERKESSPNRPACRAGLEGRTATDPLSAEGSWKGRPQTVTVR
jgi:hypothetical protein